MLFRGKKSPERTILLLDVENGSVGSALLRLSPGKQPKLFGETRAVTQVGMSRSGGTLAAQIKTAARDALRTIFGTAARVRLHPKTAPLGEINSVAVFLAPPWGKPNLSGGKPDFMPEMSDYLSGELRRSLENVPVSLYTAAGAAAFGTRSLFPPEPCLVCSVTGEVSELMRMDTEGVRAHATIPTGMHSLLRTLRTHGGLSEAEARSAAKLPFTTSHPASEALRFAAADFAGHFKDAAQELLGPGDVLRVRIIAEEPMGEWFAQSLAADPALNELFPDGGEVRSIRSHHLTPHIEAHAEVPDLPLMLEALFIDGHFNN